MVNDLDYFENAPDDKRDCGLSARAAPLCEELRPTDPTSVASAGDWVYPIYAGGDGAPHRAVVIDPNDKSNVIIGSTNAYLKKPVMDRSIKRRSRLLPGSQPHELVAGI